MPVRKVPLRVSYYYHILNRSIAKVPVFNHQRDFVRFMDITAYYRFKNPPLPFSKLMRLNTKERTVVLDNLEKETNLLIEIVAFCFMPNHFHFLLKQLQKNGIMIFLGNLQNSYAKYFNIKYQRTGGLFQNSFKAVLVEDNPQLLHLSRYIHLNPYSSLIIKRREKLISYPWSSLCQYLGKGSGFCQPEIVLNQFKSSDDYQEFVFDQADYQRELEKIKHLTLE